MNEKFYNIYRYYFKQGKAKKLIRKHLTWNETQKHVNDQATRKTGVWFDGFRLIN